MAIVLGAIADDYGASDLANTLAKTGWRPCRPSAFHPPTWCCRRSTPSSSAENPVGAVEPSPRREPPINGCARGRRTRHVQDLLDLRFHRRRQYRTGNEALRADHREHIAIVTPAFPETGRTVYRGHLFVGDLALNESPLKDHPLNPMHDSKSRARAGCPVDGKVGLLPLDAIAQGPSPPRSDLPRR